MEARFLWRHLYPGKSALCRGNYFAVDHPYRTVTRESKRHNFFTMRYGIDGDGVFHYVLDELSYDDFDKIGRVGIWKLFKMAQGARSAFFELGPSSVWRDRERTTVFIRSQSVQILPAFHSAGLTQNTPLHFAVYISHVGRTSYCLDTEIYLATTNELVAVFSLHAVLVLWETRRPTPLPAGARESVVRPDPSRERPVPSPVAPASPPGAFTLLQAVLPSDTDANEHLNQAAFVRLCVDCASMAATGGHLASFKEDVIYSDAEAVWVVYLKEATAGQELALSCWEVPEQRPEQSRVLWVEVRRGSEVIGQCQMKFYADGPKRAIPPGTKQPQTTAKL